VTRLLIFRLGVLFAASVGAVLAFIPLLGVHGVESALAMGLVLPPWVAALAARYTLSNRATRGIDLMLHAIGAGLLLWAVPTAILAVNALRVRQCTPGEGLAFVVLGPAVGCALAASVGVWVAAITRRPRLAPWFAAGIPIGATLLGLWTFYATPTVYIFGAFAGYFPGAIYDDLVRLPARYMTYRASIVLAVLAFVLLFEALWDRESGVLDPRGRAASHAGAILVAAGVLGLVAASYWHGDDLGHWVSEEYVVDQLGKTEKGRYCVVHVPRETAPDDVRRLLEDCDFHVARTLALTGMTAEEPVTAYFFRSQDEKKELIGIGRTLIAKPWRREVYLQVARWPHPVLGHEIVHAVLSSAGRGPFAVAATWGGLLPNPGIIEGAAVALAWDIRDDLDPDQWSRIMLDRGELPAADALTSLRFSSLPARRAYMAAGSLVRFLVSTRGMGSLLDAYQRGTIDGLGELETQWHAHLDGVTVTLHERGVAEVALAQPSIFSAVCPHALAELRVDLQGDAAARDDARMLATCRAILDIDEGEAQARAALVGALARSGKREAALAELGALRAATTAPKPIVAAALEAFADANWSLGRFDEAAEAYDELLALPRTDGPARQSEVKKLALESNATERDLIHQMLLGRSSSAVAVHIARALATARDDGLGPYLEARQLVGQSEYALALPLLEEAKERGLPTLRLGRELDRLLGVTYFALERYADSAAAWEARSWINPASHAEAERWLERIEYAQTGTISPKLEDPSSARPAAP
jgi:tetratricopeptide (TPR) repeat protein